MKGALSEADRERLMAEANARDALNYRHAWWVRTTTPKRKLMLRNAIRRALQGVAT